MRETRRNLLVGLFVLVGLVALGTLIVWFGRRPTMFAPADTYMVNVRFDRRRDQGRVRQRSGLQEPG